MGRIDAVIFDMDGLVLDTERQGYDAYLRAARHFDFQVNERVHMYLAGRTEPTVVAELKHLYGQDKDVASWRRYILEQKSVVLREHGGRAGKKPGLLELLNYLAENDLPYALASSSSRERVRESLASEWLVHAFPNAITGDMVMHSKPNPEIFLKAAGLLGVEPAHCLVLEDSGAGLRAARSGGFIPVFIYDDISQEGKVDGTSQVLIELADPRSVGSLASYTPNDLTEVIDIIEALNA
jgi:HAD superfamily hydrolase (TIGR01509 family)